MHKLIQTIKKASELKIYLYIFLLSTGIGMLVLFSTTTLPTQADPYYHITHAQSIWSGTAMSLPQISSIGEVQPILWHTFHLFLSPFTAFFSGNNFETLIAGAKVGYSVLFGLFFVLFYYTVSRLLAATTAITPKNLRLYGLASLLMVVALSPSFTYRIFMLRPHIISIAIILLSILFIMRKDWMPLFLTAAIFPFAYSSFYLILIPPLIYILAKGSYHFLKERQTGFFTPLLLVISGSAFGIVLHPDSLDYLYNALYVPISSILARFFTNLPLGAELYSPSIFKGELAWLIPLTAIIGIFGIYIIDRKKAPDSLAFKEWFLLSLCAGYLLLFIGISRSSEYLIPLTVILFIITFVNFALPLTQRIPALLQDSFPGVSRLTKEFFAAKNKIFFQKLFLGIFVALSTLNLIFVGLMLSKQPAHTLFQPASKYIQNRAAPGETIFHDAWGDYPRLVFFNKNNQYLMGMGPVYTYYHDTDLYWLWHHLASSPYVCPKKECTEDTHQDPYTVIREKFDARFVFTAHEVDTTTEFEKKIETDPRFQKALSYTREGKDVVVYRLE